MTCQMDPLAREKLHKVFPSQSPQQQTKFQLPRLSPTTSKETEQLQWKEEKAMVLAMLMHEKEAATCQHKGDVVRTVAEMQAHLCSTAITAADTPHQK
jgi:hypothetical protein